MLPIDKLTTAGDHPFFFEGEAGKLEAILTVPAVTQGSLVALLGHPHSLQGGSMNNKVVTTMARAFKEAGIPSLRFNFRGVGSSEGEYDAGIGESKDMLQLRALWTHHFPSSRFIFAGFSFGSYVAYRAAAQTAHALLISVAPPFHHYDYQAFSVAPFPWHIFQGETDEVVPLQVVLDFAKEASSPIPVSCFAETGHFFHGKLLLLKESLLTVIQQVANP